MWHSPRFSTFFKIIRNKYFIVGLCFTLWIVFFDQYNIVDWGSALMDVGNQKREKQYYEQEIARTREKLNELRSNKDSLEKFAREQYYYLQDGEEIFIVEEARR